MSLNQLSLSPSLLVELYSHSLVDLGVAEDSRVGETSGTVTTPQPAGFRSLGNNNRYILVVVDSQEAVHLPDNSLQFLTNMLTACQLSLADVAIVNIHQQPAMYKELITHFNARICLLFDVAPDRFGLPMSFPPFQIQAFAGCSFLYAPALTELEHDKALKSKLWTSLKRLFNL